MASGACMALLALFLPATLLASGYRIPEQSLNAVATSAARAASADNADASYYNPANMGWLDNRLQTEAALTYLYLPGIDYADARTAANNGSSKEEHFLLPSLHGVTPEYGNFRFGLSLISPAGLSKRWQQAFPRLFAEEFTLRVIELNPTVSYTFNKKFSAGAGVRLLRADGVVKSQGTIAPAALGGAVFTTISCDQAGDTVEFGYNLAVSFRPVAGLTIAATYRSRVDLGIEGDATLTAGTGFSATGATFAALPAGFYAGSVSVSVPVPAVLTLAIASTMDRTTIELAWDRTYWDAYQELDFNYAAPLAHPVLKSAFDDPKAKKWSNCDAIRFGLSHKVTDTFTLMLGFAMDENPVPDSTLNFELPDSNALVYSLGLRCKISDALDIGAAYLLSDHKTRTIDQTASGASINGVFTGAVAHLITAGMTWRF